MTERPTAVTVFGWFWRVEGEGLLDEGGRLPSGVPPRSHPRFQALLERYAEKVEH